MQTIVQFLDCLPSGRRSIFCMLGDYIKLGVPLRPAVTVTTRRLLILVGCAYKPSLASVAGTGSIPIYIYNTNIRQDHNMPYSTILKVQSCAYMFHMSRSHAESIHFCI